MKRRFVLCVLTAAGLLTLAALCAGQAGKEDDDDKYLRDLSAYVRQLQDPDPQVRARVKRRIEGIYAIVVSELEEIARTADQEYPSGSAEHYAVGLLGHWHAMQACSLLVQKIEAPCPGATRSFSRRFTEFPAARALMQMGSPAAESITEWLSTSLWPASDRRLRLFAFVIWGTEGEKLALVRLEAALDEAKKRRADERYRNLGDLPEKNLSRMIETFRSIDFKDPRQLPRL